MVNIYTNALIGISDEHVKHIAHKVIEQKGERLYIFTRNQILYHKTNHHITITISGSLFELVGHPYPINPTRELLEKILATPLVKEKNTVIVERKNVIYKIDLYNFEIM